MCEIRKIFPLEVVLPAGRRDPVLFARFLYTACPSTPDGADTTVSASLGLCLGKSESRGLHALPHRMGQAGVACEDIAQALRLSIFSASWRPKIK